MDEAKDSKTITVSAVRNLRPYALIFLAVIPAILLISDLLSGASFGTYIFHIVWVLGCVWLYKYETCQSIVYSDSTITYKYWYFVSRTVDLKVSDIAKVISRQASGLGPAVPSILLIGGEPARAVVDVSPRRLSAEGIRELLKKIHALRPDLPIPEIWLDDSVSIAEINRSTLYGLPYKKKQ